MDNERISGSPFKLYQQLISVFKHNLEFEKASMNI